MAANPLTAALEDFTNSWNVEYPNYQLTPEDLKKPQAFMGALFEMFDTLGIDRDIVLAAPAPEEHNEHISYYWDLLPVINMTRVINHLVYITPGSGAYIRIAHILQPNAMRSRSILLVLFNLMLFKNERLRAIVVKEEELFAIAHQVKALEAEHNHMIERLNSQAEEKAKQAERILKLNQVIKQIEEEYEQEKEIYNEEILELKAIQKELSDTDVVLEQKKRVRDALMDEVDKKRALRVYDGDDLKAKAEKAAQNVLGAQNKLESLQISLIQDETNLKNLQTIQPNLDTANNLLTEIMKFSDRLKDLDCEDLESDDSELYILKSEVSKLQSKLTETQTASTDASKKRVENQTKRQQEQAVAQSSVRTAVEKDKRMLEQCNKALKRTEEIKEATLKYETEKNTCIKQLADIKESFATELKSANEILLKKATEVAREVEEKLQSRHI